MRLSDFIYFPRNERRALLVVIVLVVIVAGWVYYAGEVFDTSGGEETDSLKAEYAMREYSRSGEQNNGYYNVEERKAERFPFDPNTADSTTLLRLGLSPWQVRNIYRYRAKGGIYRKATDFARLYGLTAGQYRELEPYIRISPDYRPAAEVYATSNEEYHYQRDTLRYPLKIHPGQHIILNRADTTELKKVPGIGSGWARAVINYGRRLGGYCRVQQLTEIEGFPEDALQYFKVENPQPVKLNINKASLSRLRSHPYINFFQARAIRDHIRLHGPLHSLQQLALLPDFPDEAIARLEPYIEY